MRSLRPQRGLASAAIVIILILTALALVLGRGYFQGQASLDQRGSTEANLRRVSDALVGFASLNRRLPCPANGNSADGNELPAGPAASCTHEDGVVPWVTLGLRREDAVDAWGGKISYRVYAPTGSGDGFTRANGVNATNCSTEVGVGGISEVVTDCDSAAHFDHPVHFQRATADPSKLRGLAVNDRGTTMEGLAFVLVSHGPSGRGAFGVESNVRTSAPASATELRNTQAPSSPAWSSPFMINAHSDVAVSPDDAGHFDDIVAYTTASELIARAKLTARAWPSYPLVADAPTIMALVPGFNPSDTQDTGQTSLAFGRVTVTASSSLGTQNIGFRERGDVPGVGAIGGLGVISAGSTSGGSISSTNSEVLRFDAGAGSTFQKVDVAFNEFQTRSSWPFAREEVEISVWQSGDRLQSTTVASWHSDTDLPSRCLFESIPGTIFDRMDVRPLVRSDGGASSLTIASVRACSVAVSACSTSVPGAVDCPAPPPSATTQAPSGLGQTSAILNGFVDDHGSAAAATFEYGTTCAYPSNVAATPGTVSAGSGVTAVSAAIAGLACNTSYYFRAKAVSAGGTTISGDDMFTTAACASPMPKATSGQATNILVASATLNGVVDANGATTTVTFDFGPSRCYGSGIPASPGSVSVGAGATAVVASATGLSCNTRYHYRVRGASAAGTTTSNDVAFTTAPCP